MTSSVTQIGIERTSAEGGPGQSTTLNLPPASSTALCTGVFCGEVNADAIHGHKLHNDWFAVGVVDQVQIVADASGRIDDAPNLTVGLCHPDGWIWLAIDGEVPAAACVIVASTVTVALAWA